MFKKAEVTDYEERKSYVDDFEGVIREFKVFNEDGEHDVEVYIGTVFVDKDDLSEEDLQDLVKEGYKVGLDVVEMPTIMVIWNGVFDYEETDPDWDILVDKVVERYFEIPREYFEF